MPMQTDTDPLGSVPSVTVDGGIIPFDCFFLFIELRSVRCQAGERAHATLHARAWRRRARAAWRGAFLPPYTGPLPDVRITVPFSSLTSPDGAGEVARRFGGSMGESADDILGNQLTGDATLPTRVAFLCPCTSHRTTERRRGMEGGRGPA